MKCPTHEVCPSHAHIESFGSAWQPPTPRHDQVARELTDDNLGYCELGYAFTKAIDRIVKAEHKAD